MKFTIYSLLLFVLLSSITYAQDSYCDAAGNGMCDPDCQLGVDPDCSTCNNNGICEQNEANCNDCTISFQKLQTILIYAVIGIVVLFVLYFLLSLLTRSAGKSVDVELEVKLRLKRAGWSDEQIDLHLKKPKRVRHSEQS